MPIDNSFDRSPHPLVQKELEVLKMCRDPRGCVTGRASVDDALSAETPKYATMPFNSAASSSEWVTVAGAHSTPVFLYISDVNESSDRFAARLSAACKLPVLRVRCAPFAGEHCKEGIANVLSVFKELQNSRIPATQIIMVGHGSAAMLAHSALLRLAETEQPLPRCTIAIAPVIDGSCFREETQSNGKEVLSQVGLLSVSEPPRKSGLYNSPSQSSEGVSLLVTAGDDEIQKRDCVRLAERAVSAGIGTRLSLHGGMPHDFALFDLPSSRELFQEIQAFVSSGSSSQELIPLTIQRVGWAGYLIVTEAGTKVLIDPYQCGSEGFHSGLPESMIQPKDLFDVDVVAVTHAGFDHRGQSLEIVQGGNAILVCGPALYAEAIEQHVPTNRMAPMVSGFEVRCKDVTIKAVPARHESSMELRGKFRADQAMSFIVTTAAGTRIFCGGDSSISEDFKTWGSLYSPDIAILGIGGLWVGPIDAVELPPREAMLAASWLGVKTVIPVHYAPGDPAPLQLRAEVEAATLPINVEILDFGQTWTRPLETSNAGRAK